MCESKVKYLARNCNEKEIKKIITINLIKRNLKL